MSKLGCCWLVCRWCPLFILVWSTITVAQENKSPVVRKEFFARSLGHTDFVARRQIRIDSIAGVVHDSALAVRDSLFYSSLKRRMYQRHLTRRLYDLLFRDVYNSRLKTGEVSRLETNPFQPYEGRVIGNIYIRRLDVFGQSVYDTLRDSHNWLERLGNQLHVDTREWVIRRSFLLFQEGNRVNAETLRDNERLLRNSNVFHDVRIMVVPQTGSSVYVDVYVITQDIWSLLPSGSFSSFNRFNIQLEQRNFRGLGHTFINSVSFDGNDPLQKLNYRGRYSVPYIGKTFLTGQADLIYERDLKQATVRIYRPFLTPDTRWAGSIELSRNELRNRVFISKDSSLVFPLEYNHNDVWVGHAFRPFFGSFKEEERPRLVVAGRISRYLFTKRPPIRPDTNQLYQNSRTTLFSVGLSKRRYVRDVLIYGFGRTEDVPYGSQAALIGGFDYAELGERFYMGFNYASARYFRSFGYVYGLINLGGFVRRNFALEQGVMTLESRYFSPLWKTGLGMFRHFINIRYTRGANRFNYESITLGGQDRIGINNDALRGTKLLLAGFENILFSKLDILGFRIAFVTFIDLGMISFPNRFLLKGPLYQGYGIAFRLRNENLAFNSFQIRLTYYPNIPNNQQSFRFVFDGTPAARFPDFAIPAPEISPYQ